MTHQLNEYRQWLVTENRSLVRHMVDTTSAGLYLGRQERVAVGNYQLCKAALNFDPYHGERFSTYACQAIYRGLVVAGRESGLIRVGRDDRSRESDPGAKEAARRARRVYSLWGADGEMWFDPPDRGDVAPIDRRLQERIDRLEKAITLLNPNHREMIAYFLRGMNPAQIGRVMGVSKQRVHQIKRQAFNHIRHTMEVQEELAR